MDTDTIMGKKQIHEKIIAHPKGFLKKEQRRNPRIETFTLVSYILFNKNGKAVDRGKGRTINLSQNGILLETLNPLNDAFVMLMAIDIAGKEVRTKGRVIYSELQVTTGFYVSGIDFIGHKEHQVGAIVAFIKVYLFNKSKGIIPELTEISTLIQNKVSGGIP